MEAKMEESIEQYALSLGFDLVGFTPGKLPQKYIKTHEKWLEEGYEAGMEYMKKPRINDAKSVIVLGKNYYYDQPKLLPGHGRIARYAYGRDYHKVIGKMLKKLEQYIAGLAPKAIARSYVDTGPVLERAFAEQANLGFIGKNSCLISPEFGSWIFLAVIFTNLNLRPNRKSIKISCGACTRCIDACPTGAIRAPGVIDANKCLSYHTIENRGKIPKPIANQIHKTKRIFGCDICQEACPHNLVRQKPATGDGLTTAPFSTPIASDQISLAEIAAIKTDAKFLAAFAGSPLMRAKRKGLNRNANYGL
ncbi:MAG: tRNA epoxyqueuosine(34) reductase QueG [Nitrospirota bacterium]